MMTKSVIVECRKLSSNSLPSISDRILAALTYLTAGAVGFFWLIILWVAKRRFPSIFLMFHISQSILLSLCFVVVNYLFWHIVNFLNYIPFINRLVRQLVYLFNMPVLMGYSIMQCLIYGTVLYLAVFAFMGLYSYFPWITDLIKSNFNR